MKKTQGLAPVLIVLFLAILLGGGYVVFDKFEVGSLNEKTKADEITDWKTYRNEEYGFQLRHPASIDVTENPMPNGRVMFGFSYPAESQNQWSLNVYTGQRRDTLVSNLQKLFEGDMSISSVSFLGTSATKVTITKVKPDTNAVHIIYEGDENTFDFVGGISDPDFSRFYNSFSLDR